MIADLDDATLTVDTNGVAAAPVAATLEVMDHDDPLPQHFMAGVPLGPLSIGRHGAFRIDHESVLPVHGYVSFDGRAVYTCSVDPRHPILVNGQPVRAGSWTRLDLPCRVQIGGVAARLHRHSMIRLTPNSPSFGPPSERTRVDWTAGTDLRPPRGSRATPTSFDPEVTRFDIAAPARPTVPGPAGPGPAGPGRAKESSARLPIEPPSARSDARSGAQSVTTPSLDRTVPRRRRRPTRLGTTVAVSLLLVIALAAGGWTWRKRPLASPAPTPGSPAEPAAAPAAPAAASSEPSEPSEEPLGTVVLTAPAMERSTTTPSRERAAADALRRGDRESALALYAALAKEHPTHPAFGRIARMLD